MDLKRLASAAAIAAAVGISTLMFGAGPVDAAPMPNPSPAPTTGTAPIPGSVHEPAAAPTEDQGPHSGGGGPHSGGGAMTGKPAP
jgi:hypothetical protein